MQALDDVCLTLELGLVVSLEGSHADFEGVLSSAEVFDLASEGVEVTVVELVRLNLSPVCSCNSVSESLGLLLHVVASLVLSLHLLVLRMLSLFALLTVLLVETELGLSRLSWLLVAHIDLSIEALLDLLQLRLLNMLWLDHWLLNDVWRSLAEWRISIVKGILLEGRSLLLTALVGSGEVLTIVRLVVFEASFALSLLGVRGFPGEGLRSSCSLSEVVGGSITVLGF